MNKVLLSKLSYIIYKMHKTYLIWYLQLRNGKKYDWIKFYQWLCLLLISITIVSKLSLQIVKEIKSQLKFRKKNVNNLNEMISKSMSIYSQNFLTFNIEQKTGLIFWLIELIKL